MPAVITQLTTQQQQALQNALRKYAGQVSAAKLKQILAGIKDSLTNVLNPQQVERDGKMVTEGLNPATARNAIADLLKKVTPEALADEIDFTVKTATEVARGAGNYVQANDSDVVEAYPAWELLRVYDRTVPRGFRRGPKGGLIPVPSDAWPARWVAACRAAGDDKALAVFEKTGRMIALKSSGVWQALGDGAGGYEDTLGNAFAPFAFNSGYDTDEVSDQDCLDLGLLEPGETPKGAAINFAKLFSPIEEAA
jgi:hypothetical protein